MIYTIPISRVGAANKQIWDLSKKRKFFVKSVYYVDQQRKKASEVGTSYKGEDAELWKKMWNLDVPGVLKRFL